MFPFPHFFLLFLFSVALWSQPGSELDPSFRKRVVTVGGGAGLVIGKDTHNFYVVTASHVVGRINEVKSVNVFVGEQPVACEVIHSPCNKKQKDGSGGCLATKENPTEDDVLRKADIALLSCPSKGIADLPGSGEILAWRGRFGWGQRVAVLSNSSGATGGRIGAPPTWFALSSEYKGKQSIADIDVAIPNITQLGVSGGPLVNDRSEVLGIAYETTVTGTLNVHPWAKVKAALRRQEKQIELAKERSPSASFPAGRQTQVTFAVQSILVPGFTELKATPWFRLAKPIPSFPRLQVAFDFTTGERNLERESLRLTVPAVSAQYQLAPHLGFLRRSYVLGGLYVGAGAGWALMDSRDTLANFLRQRNSRSWTGIYELGSNWRAANKPWGLNFAYREYVSMQTGFNVAYPRYRAFSGGVFLRIN